MLWNPWTNFVFNLNTLLSPTLKSIYIFLIIHDNEKFEFRNNVHVKNNLDIKNRHLEDLQKDFF